MRGPGGRGEVEVAVSGIAGQRSLFICLVNILFQVYLKKYFELKKKNKFLVKCTSKKESQSVAIEMHYTKIILFGKPYTRWLPCDGKSNHNCLFFLDQSDQHSDLLSTTQLSSKGSGISLATILHRAASAASVLAKQAYAASSPNNQSDLELLPLKCCLMSISLPWEHIAHDLLFKVRSSSIHNIISKSFSS